MKIYAEDYRDYVRKYLTDYNDNFVGEPCEEIINQVITSLSEKIHNMHDNVSEDKILNTIDDICSELFD